MANGLSPSDLLREIDRPFGFRKDLSPSDLFLRTIGIRPLYSENEPVIGSPAIPWYLMAGPSAINFPEMAALGVLIGADQLRHRLPKYLQQFRR